MLTIYPACFFHDEDGYSVMFPDLNYLSTCGKTLEEALEMAVDCLAGYIHTCQVDGDTIPNPSSIQSIDIEKYAKEYDTSPNDIFVNLVSVDVEEYAKKHFEKAVKKTLTIPAWLNAAALERNVNFSQVLQDALKEIVKAQ